MYELIDIFKDKLIFFEIKKVKAHVKNSNNIHEKLNNKVDKLARDAVNQSNRELNYNLAPYNYCLYCHIV